MWFNGANYIFRKNLQGDVVGICDSNGNLLGSYTYDAWGKILSSGSTTIFAENPFRFRGYYYDTETQLYYLQTRYYDPETGRFLNADAYSYLEPETVNGLNLYAYCLNNPVMGADPEGTSLLLTLFFGFVIGASLSAVFEVAKQVDGNGWDASRWDWKQIGLSALGGGVAGLISAIPVGSAVSACLLGGVGAAIGGFISGTVTDVNSFMITVGVGAVANLLGYGIAKGIESFRVDKLMAMTPKARSASIWAIKGVDPSSLLKDARYIFMNYSKEQVAEVVKSASIWLQAGVQSSFVSSFLSSLQSFIW